MRLITSPSHNRDVITAKAGTHLSTCAGRELGPCFRRDDTEFRVLPGGKCPMGAAPRQHEAVNLAHVSFRWDDSREETRIVLGRKGEGMS
ncbi:MAG: hypothetical protein BGO83_21325 [Devosia sp. 66-14]|jgi:hypothetical protein|nr:MAG: hypothetical protein ABS47_15355 [Devosia sp. SCN 66-27]OJX26434.1 MAG: hypothetical protein BGO83_21325 [Devosia sp. 66-14]